jgi:hypothetical protein
MEMTDREIMNWLHSMDIYDYDICDGVVHVVGDVDLNGRGLGSIPLRFGCLSGNFFCTSRGIGCIPFQFGYVSGNFLCTGNNLESLAGCPSEVGGDFDCRSNWFVGKPDTSHITIGGEFRWE